MAIRWQNATLAATEAFIQKSRCFTLLQYSSGGAETAHSTSRAPGPFSQYRRVSHNPEQDMCHDFFKGEKNVQCQTLSPLLLKEQDMKFPFVSAHTGFLLRRQPSCQGIVLVASFFALLLLSKFCLLCILLHPVSLFQAKFSMLSI